MYPTYFKYFYCMYNVSNLKDDINLYVKPGLRPILADKDIILA